MKKLSVLRYKKWLAVFLSVIMLFSMLPTFIFNASAATGNFTKKSDPSTVNDWKIFFGPDVKDTTWAGGVWSDKSVFKTVKDYTDATDEDDDSINLSIGANNFLVSLSTIASSKSIEGYSTLPTDTVLVLDLSGSMDVTQGTDPYVTMVNSANSAIDKLLSLNPNNRVGVVAYSGNTSTNSAATASTATVILPLGRYEKGIDNSNNRVYLVSSWTERSGRNTVTRNGVKVASGVTGTKAPGVTSTFSESNSKTVTGGTYTQNGIYKAQQMLGEVTDITVTDGVQAGTKRKPVLVLMTDGSPTIASTDYTKIDTSNSGNGNEASYGSVGISFMTQLTAAYARDKIEEKYGSAPLVYTLGLNVGTKQAALSLLDPSNNTGTDSYWTTFKGLANQQNKTMNVQIRVNGTENKSITYTSPVNAQRGWSEDYVTKYFGASNASDLTKAFEDIVEQIVIQSLYYPTLVESNIGVNHDGFLEFDDYIGKNMEVKAIKGIQLGSTLYDGSTLAKMIYSGGMGTENNPTDVGDNFVWAVKERMGITDTAVARELIGKAYSAGQLYYNPTTQQYSNYIGWYADGKGKYVGFWDGKDASPEAVPDSLKSTAVFAIKSYGYYDAVGEGHRKTDMMYATIQVRTTLKDTASDKYDASQVGDIRVIGKIPASLIPLVEYNIKLNGTDPMNPSEMIISGATAPSRLLYEVGLSSKIDVLNIEETAPDTLVKNSDGDYVFYTNQWHDIGEYSYLSNKNTISYFEPSVENERYYYNVDSDIFTDKNGTYYRSENAPVYNENSPLYHRDLVYSATSGTLTAKWSYEEISEHVLTHVGDIAKRSDNTWYVTAGTIHHYFGDYELEKEDNLTNTVNYSDKPFVHDPEQGKEEQGDYHVDSYLGNNGMLTFNSYEGVKIEKTADATITDREQEYEFILSADVNANLTLIKEDIKGARTESNIAFNNTYSVNLKHGEKAYLLGEALIGKQVTVKENIPVSADYRVYSVNGDKDKDTATITVAKSVINTAAFVNTVPQEGDVVITKNVVSDFSGHTSADFTFTVNISANGTFTAVKTDSGAMQIKSGDTVTLKHGQSLDIEGLPEGTTVTVTETNIPVGFSVNDAEQDITVVSGETKYIDFVNTYSAGQTDKANIEITVNKNVADNLGAAADITANFKFQLQKWNGTEYENVGGPVTVSYTKNGSNSVKIDALKDVVYTTAGENYYRIVEIEEEANVRNGIIYDTSYARFVVKVVDDGSGKLKVDAVEGIVDTSVSGTNVSAVFDNTYTVSGAAEVIIDVNKVIQNAYNQTANILPAGFSFSLYKADENYVITKNTAVATSPVTAAAGTTRLSLVYDTEGTHHYVLKEDSGNIDNVTYTDKTYSIKVVVDDDGSGHFTVSAWVYDGKTLKDSDSKTATDSSRIAAVEVDGITFTNTYTPDSVTAVANLRGIKHLMGRSITNEDNFTFALYKTGADYATSGITPETKVANVQDGIFNFGSLVYEKEGTHYYVIKEVIPSTALNNVLDGVTYDTREYRIKIVITGDAVTGKLTATPTMTVFDGSSETASTAIIFNNTYTVSGTDAVIVGNKTLTGGIRKLQAGAFNFALYENGNPVQTVSNLIPSSDTTAPFEFKLHYDTVGVHNYTVKEVIPSGVDADNKLDGVKYDGSEYDVTVTVTDNGKGSLVAAVDYVDGSVEFENSYTVSAAKVTLYGKKELKGDDIAKYTGEKAFAFELYNAKLVDDCIEQGTLIETAKNNADGSVTFKELSFSAIGGYRYVIREVVPSDADALMEYDTSVYLVEIDVTDNLKGGLESKVSYTRYIDNESLEESLAVFNNQLHVESVMAEIKGEKKYNKTLSGDEFTFELYQALKGADGKINAVGEVALTAKNGADGKFLFKDSADTGYITYNKVGTYYYVIKESIPEGAVNNVLDGITYDTAQYTVTVTVTEGVKNGRSILETQVSYSDEVVFENTYSAKGTAKIEGKKTLNGKDLEGNDFTFVLYGEDGKEIERVKNAKDGSFSFTLDYTKAGTYKYVVKEDTTDKKKGITYDTAEYNVTVTVTDNNDGTLSAMFIAEKGGEAVQSIEFTNKYTEPSPVTGDGMNIGATITIGLISLMMCLALTILKKKSCKA